MHASDTAFAAGTIGARIEAAATTMGDRPLLEIGGEVLSAVAVAESVRAYARAITDATEPGDRVAVRADGDAPTLLLLLAVTAAGRIAVPLDPREPPERLDRFLQFADPALAIRATGPGDAIWTAWAPPEDDTGPRAAPDAAATPADPALLLFTSGTTGRPKGIVRTQRMLVAQAGTQAALWERVSSKRLGNVYPPSFLGGIINILACVEAQATFCGLDVATLGPGGLAVAVRDHRLTMFLAVPSLLRSVCEHARRHSTVLDRLELVAFGGEPITVADLRLMRAVMPHAALLNCYGTQEAGTAAIQFVGDVDDDTLVPAGTPMPESDILVVDGTTLCGPGAVGEVLLAGPNVCVEYWRDPAATEAARVEIDGTVAMRTGDLGRWQDGVLEIVGRTDHRVKVRGQGVDLSAVEAAFGADEAIVAAVVTSLPDPRSGNRLVAHLEMVPGAALDPVEVRRALHDRLPGYMVPGTILVVDELPLTPRGKVDRATLHEAALAAPRPVRGRDPGTAVETQVRDLMAEVLAVPADDLGCDDDFAAHGGDSLRALELLEALDATFGLDPGTRLALEECFAGPTSVEAIAHALTIGTTERPRITRDGAALVPVGTAPSGAPIHCFLLTGAAQPPLVLRALADRLGATPLATFLPRGVLDRRWPDRTLGALARRNVALLREHQPDGTRVLVGYSFGALVALEMARQMRAAGEDVPLVVVVDARVRRTRAARGPLHRVVVFLVTEIQGRLLAPVVVACDPSPRRRQRALLKLCGALYWHHAPRPYDGDVLVVRAAINTRPPPDLGWSEVVTGALQVVEIPGTHDSVLRVPDVDGLARVLRDAFSRLEPSAE